MSNEVENILRAFKTIINAAKVDPESAIRLGGNFVLKHSETIQYALERLALRSDGSQKEPPHGN